MTPEKGKITVSFCFCLFHEVQGVVKAFNAGEAGFNHTALRVDFPITLNDSVTITPFIAAVFPIDALKAGGFDENEVHGGIACQIKF